MGNSMHSKYIPPTAKSWVGRVDGDTDAHLRWHQVVELQTLTQNLDVNGSLVLLGFACDEGVRRNKGRVGAAAAPLVLRSILAGLPVHFDSKLRLVDLGDIQCIDQQLAPAQDALAEAVYLIRQGGGFPLLLGGGHEITYAHFKGLQKAAKGSIGIINIDAHLDLREPINGRATSGTGFYQIAEACKLAHQEFHYLALGIQQISNTKALFQRAEELGVQMVSADELQSQKSQTLKKILAFTRAVDQVYLTVDMDAFAAPYAPGVSAVAFNGIVPNPDFMEILQCIMDCPNLIAIDIAELNPQYDQDQRTAKLAASILFRMLQKKKASG